MLNSDPKVSVRVLDGFDDLAIHDAVWQRLLRCGQTDVVFLTRWWQNAWWEVFGRGRLMLLGVFRGEEPVGLAPLFSDGGMIFFTGSGGSDYLDFIGEIPDTTVLAELLGRAASIAPEFVGFHFYQVPDGSQTGAALQQAARRLGMVCYDEADLPAPAVDLTITGDQVARKKSLLRHQRYFERDGTLTIRHFRTGADILPRLEPFFAQHVARWAVTPYPSLFLDPAQRRFYRALAESAAAGPWLRFTEVSWNDRPIAFHFGFCYRGGYMWYKPSFEIELARRSPGEALIRSLLLAALDEGVNVFDLGLGRRRSRNDSPLIRTMCAHGACTRPRARMTAAWKEEADRMASRVLVISPHPDDEAIGCGGTLRRHFLAGDRVRVVFLTSGDLGGHGLDPAETAHRRDGEARESAGIMRIEEIEFWRERDGALRSMRLLVERLAATAESLRPDLIYVPGEQEAHSDHRAAAGVVRAACKGVTVRPRVLMFEVWTLVTVIDEIVDISPHIETKLAAIRAYRSQCDVLRFDDAFLGLARYRGEMFCWPKDPQSSPGKYAEVFRLLSG
jgi:LmbE family N-acetylglucosaminyl deacetylase/CelD/BcsL family acetyltransferase involved in cellulose biosynthesis